MLLRANSELTGAETNITSVTNSEVESGVREGILLAQLVELTLNPDAGDAAKVREQIRANLGDEALVDAAAVLGNFQRMVRIADGTGIPLDRPVSVVSANLRAELGVDQFESASRTPKVGKMTAWVGDKIRPMVMKRIAKQRKGMN